MFAFTTMPKARMPRPEIEVSPDVFFLLSDVQHKVWQFNLVDVSSALLGKLQSIRWVSTNHTHCIVHYTLLQHFNSWCSSQHCSTGQKAMYRLLGIVHMNPEIEQEKWDHSEVCLSHHPIMFIFPSWFCLWIFTNTLLLWIMAVGGEIWPWWSTDTGVILWRLWRWCSS